MKCSLIDVIVGIAVLTQRWCSEYWSNLRQGKEGAVIGTWLIGWTIVFGSIILYVVTFVMSSHREPFFMTVFFSYVFGFMGSIALAMLYSFVVWIYNALKKACEVGHTIRNPFEK